MTSPSSEIRFGEPLTQIDTIIEMYEPYHAADRQLSEARYINHAHDSQPEGMSQEKWDEYKRQFPATPHREVETLEATLTTQRENLFTFIGISDPETQDRVLLACRGLLDTRLYLPRQVAEEKPEVHNPVVVHGTSTDYEHEWYSTLDGLITLAQVTGEEFNLYTGPSYGSPHSPVTAETPRPKIPEAYDPNHWPELREIQHNLGRYAREFFVDQYQAKDPALLEKYSQLVERLREHKGQPLLAVTEFKDSTVVSIGDISEEPELEVAYFGNRPLMQGEISVAVQTPRGAGIVVVERLWADDGKRIQRFHKPIEVYIGNEEVNKYIAEHPDQASEIARRHTPM